MTTITIKELHARTGEWVRKARQTGEITVTDRGHPIAVIQPVPVSPATLTPPVNPGLSRKISAVGEALQCRLMENAEADLPPKRENPFLTRKLLPGFAALQERLTGGTDSTELISEMRDGR
ncbi:MAG: type II toxin-antitoxin system prevent-host-death family antitoxin [Verrucomicrobiota bacterium]